MEPLSVLIAVVAPAVTGGGGVRLGRRQRAMTNPPAVCEGCAHSLSFVDETGRCHAMVETNEQFIDPAARRTTRLRQCGCQQYIGTDPADRMLAAFQPTYLPKPTDKEQP